MAGPPGQPTPDNVPIIEQVESEDPSAALNAEIDDLQTQIAQAEKELASE